MIVEEVLEKVEAARAKVVLVTKYLSVEDTQKALEEVQGRACVWGLGENRVEQVLEKNLPREVVHFIGNIQGRRIAEIAQRCSVVHSLCSMEHAQKFAQQPRVPRVFIQVNVSGEGQKQGVQPEELEQMIREVREMGLEVLGIAGMGVGECTVKEKEREFETLLELRDVYVPGGLVSAGTSRDYEIALRMGVNVVRVGQAGFDCL